MPVRDSSGDLFYVPDNMEERLSAYTAIMVDQPEVYISAASSARGAKPDHLKVLADVVRDNIVGPILRRGYDVVEQPGSGTLYLRMALTEVYLERLDGAEDYSPVRLEAYTSVDAGMDQLAEFYTLHAATLEMQLIDSMSGELLAAGIIRRGYADKAPGEDSGGSRDTSLAVVEDIGDRLGCRLVNATRSEPQRERCDR